MTTPAPSPAPPKRSRRMVIWLVAVPIVILLLALAGANWKRFHLAYAKHLMGSDDQHEQYRGFQMVFRTHLRNGMSLEKVRAILAPASVTDTRSSTSSFGRLEARLFTVSVEGSHFTAFLGFDDRDKLRVIEVLNDPQTE